MRVLLVTEDIFDAPGGGQRFFASVVQSNPDVEFYAFLSGSEQLNNYPRNFHFIKLTDIYRRVHDRINLDAVRGRWPGASLVGKSYDVAQILDMAASVPDIHFDHVEIPDYLPFGVLLPEALRYHNVRFDRVVLSMHGTLSMGVRDNWLENPGDLSALTAFERLLYRYADIRYGISRSYTDSWSESETFPAHLLGLQHVYHSLFRDLKPQTGARSGDHAPDVCFVGRQEKWKGPDLFVELCSRLPRDIFRDVRFFGPSVNIEGHGSTETLQRLARHRNLDIHQETVAPAAMLDRLRRERMVVFTPSRRDTFNLSALEALLSGCPTVISTGCGVRDFLDTALPELPYVRLDADDILGCYDELVDLLRNYDAACDRLAGALAQATPGPYGTDLKQIYASRPEADPNVRRVVRVIFDDIRDCLHGNTFANLENRFADEAAERFGVVLGNHSKVMRDHNVAVAQFRRSTALKRLRETVNVAPATAKRRIIAGSTGLLGSTCFHGDRVAAYRLLAEWEQERGNDLLHATYILRVMRLTGRVDRDELSRVEAILSGSDLAEEAVAAGLLHSDNEDAVLRYLTEQCSRFKEPPPASGLAEIVAFHDNDATPKVSIIVSVYNGADKADTFLSGLERLTAQSKAISEVIIVDSNSPDNSREVFLERLKKSQARGLNALYVRSVERETIQRAWNRGITLARGKYLSFLGLDEMSRPDSFAKMAEFLDTHPDIDWVQGSAVITEVNEAGSYVRDVMAYDRMFDTQDMHYLECCYISYVGALYRKSIHDRVGLYDDRFRGAGDTEFKNRALPFIRAHTLPETLGTFLNYPEERTTQSARVEIEDVRAWYLHRTPGGVRYAFDGRPDEDVVKFFRRALHYKKSYMDTICTDIEYALSIARYAAKHRPVAYAAIEQFLPNLFGLQIAYRRFDDLSEPMPSALNGFHVLGGELEHVWFSLSQAEQTHRLLGLPAEYRITNDNRWHQHHTLWLSKPQKFTVEGPVSARDLAGAQDLGEALSACGSNHPAVDFDSAWRTGRTEQLLRLFDQSSLDVLVWASEGQGVPMIERFLADGYEPHLRRHGVSMVLAGVDPDSIQGRGDPKLFAIGDVRVVRPAFAACRMVALPAFERLAAEQVLEDAVQALAYGKPLVVSTAIASELGNLAKGLSLAGLPVAENAAQMAGLIRDLLADETQRAAAVGAGRAILDALIARGVVRMEGGGEGEGCAPVEWNSDFLTIGRFVRACFEKTSELSELLWKIDARLPDPAFRRCLTACLDSLFVAKDAPILSTQQPLFVKLSGMPSFVDARASFAWLALQANPEIKAEYDQVFGENSIPLPFALTNQRPQRKTNPSIVMVFAHGCDRDFCCDAVERAGTLAHTVQGELTVANFTGEGDAGQSDVRFIPMDVRLPSVLQKADLVLYIGDELADLRQSSLGLGLVSLLTSKAVLGTQSAFWFLPEGKRCDVRTLDEVFSAAGAYLGARPGRAVERRSLADLKT